MTAVTPTKNFVNVEWLKHLAQGTKHIKQRSYELMQIQPSSQVLDVGCGPAIDTIPLLEYIGDKGRIVGVDYDPLMIDTARALPLLALKYGVGFWNFTYQVGDTET